MDLDNLLNDTLDEFLLECVSEKVEEVSELPKMLKDINYLDRKQELLDRMTKCEILDGDDAFVESYCLSGNEIHIQYYMDFILQTFIDGQIIWRVQGCAQAELAIPDANTADWPVFDADSIDFLDTYKEYKKLVHFKNIIYKEIECDTI